MGLRNSRALMRQWGAPTARVAPMGIGGVFTANVEEPEAVGSVNLGTAWMFLGDSQTGGRANGVTLSPITAFTNIWFKTYGSTSSSVTNGESGRSLQETMTWYGTNANRTNRNWVHFQESGNQNLTGQTTAGSFANTWSTFVRQIGSVTPNAIISTEDAHSFGLLGSSGRDWTEWNTQMRLKGSEVYTQYGISVYVFPVVRNIDAYGDLIGDENVWFPTGDNARHYTDQGNFMIALTMYDGLGYDIDALDISGITTVSTTDKNHALDVIHSFEV